MKRETTETGRILNLSVKPLDLLALLDVATLRGYKWMKNNPDVINRYTRRYYRMEFDRTALMNRIKSYKKHLKKLK